MRWKWATVRSEFIKQRGTRPQAAVAEAGDIHQSAVSKLENNDKLGPAVEIFLNAIEGLGVPVSSFFAQIEALRKSPLTAVGDRPNTPRDPSDDAVTLSPKNVSVEAATALLADAILRQARGDHGRLDRRRKQTASAGPDKPSASTNRRSRRKKTA